LFYPNIIWLIFPQIFGQYLAKTCCILHVSADKNSAQTPVRSCAPLPGIAYSGFKKKRKESAAHGTLDDFQAAPRSLLPAIWIPET
jgi:hypothetical protein